MSAHLTYRPRDGVVFGMAAGKSFRLTTARNQASLAAWHEAVLLGNAVAAPKAVPVSPPAQPLGRQLTVVENAPLSIYDFPGEYAQRFDGIDRGGNAGGLPNHRHPGRAVFVKQPAGGFYLHGPPACGNSRCVVIAQPWDPLFSALKTARQVTFVVEL